MNEPEKFEGWALLELLGHRQRPGFVKEVEMAGTPFFRVDIPTDDGDVTEFYSGSSVYALRPAAEDVVRDAAKRSGFSRPVRPVDYREPDMKQLSHDHDFDDCDDDEGMPL